MARTNTKLKPLFKDLEKTGIKEFLLTTEFDRFCIEHEYDEVWQSILSGAEAWGEFEPPKEEKEKSFEVLKMLLNRFFGRQRFIDFTYSLLVRYLEWEKKEFDYQNIISDLELLGFRSGQIEELKRVINEANKSIESKQKLIVDPSNSKGDNFENEDFEFMDKDEVIEFIDAQIRKGQESLNETGPNRSLIFENSAESLLTLLVGKDHGHYKNFTKNRKYSNPGTAPGINVKIGILKSLKEEYEKGFRVFRGNNIEGEEKKTNDTASISNEEIEVLQDRFLDLIRTNNHKTLMDELSKYSRKVKNTELLKDVLILTSRWDRIKKEKNSNTTPREQLEIELNNINNALVDLIMNRLG